MAKLVECNFKPGDIVRHKRKDRTKRYLIINRYKNTVFLAEWLLDKENPWSCVQNTRRGIKVNTLNFCYILDPVIKVLYG